MNHYRNFFDMTLFSVSFAFLKSRRRRRKKLDFIADNNVDCFANYVPCMMSAMDGRWGNNDDDVGDNDDARAAASDAVKDYLLWLE